MTIITKEPNFVYVHVPRTGGVSLTEKWCDGVGLLAGSSKIVHRMVHGSQAWVKALVDMNECYCVFTMRNPYDRAVSLFRHAMGSLKCKSFDDFLRRIDQHAPKWLFAPYSNYVDNHEDFNSIIDFEFLVPQMAKALKEAGFERTKIPRLNSTRRKHKRLSDYYTPFGRAKVEEFYASDFELYRKTLGKEAVI